jgi:hypothetical protein
MKRFIKLSSGKYLCLVCDRGMSAEDARFHVLHCRATTQAALTGWLNYDGQQLIKGRVEP